MDLKDTDRRRKLMHSFKRQENIPGLSVYLLPPQWFRYFATDIKIGLTRKL